MDVPIFAEEGVLDEASIEMETADEDEIQRFRDFLDHVEPQDFL
jgi:bifunctional DNase/RNase